MVTQTTATLPTRTTRKVWDFGTPVAPATLVANDVACVLCYVSTSSNADGTPKYSWKSLRPTYVAACHALDIGVISLWEASGPDPLQGYPKGWTHGLQAVKSCNSLGYPHGLPIIAAVDYDVGVANLNASAGYMKGFHEALTADGRWATGVYGDSDIMKRCADMGTASIFHQAGARAWSNFKVIDIAHLLQSISGSTPNWDNNYVLRDLSMWLPHEVPDPIPTPIPGGNDMPALASPQTVFDTRQGFGPMPAGWASWINIGHPEITSAYIHVTVINPKAPGFIKVWDSNTAVEPSGATVDYTSGVSGTGALVPVSDGYIFLKTSSELEGLIIIVQGGM